MKFNVNHKVRFDRGRTYYSYLNPILTAGLVWIFSKGDWIDSTLAALSVFVMIYVFGFLDQKLNVLKREQKIYSEENPVLMDIKNEIKKLNESISNNNSVQAPKDTPESSK